MPIFPAYDSQKFIRAFTYIAPEPENLKSHVIEVYPTLLQLPQCRMLLISFVSLENSSHH